MAVVAERQQVRHVHAGGEDLRVAGQHDAAHALVQRRVERVDQRPAQFGIERIDRRARQPDLADVAMVDGVDESGHSSAP